MDKPTALLGHSYNHLVNAGAFSPFPCPEPEKIGDESYIEFFGAGLSLVLSDGVTVAAVHLHSQGHEGFNEFVDEMPDRLRFDMDRQSVRSLLGDPQDYSDGIKVIVLGQKPAWDVYQRSGYQLHIEYSSSMKSIQLITLGAL